MARDPNRRITIISGATQLFLSQGYAAVTIDEICALTNSAKGSFYHFFSSKEDMAIQLVDEVWHEMEIRMQGTFSKDKEPLIRIRDELTETCAHTAILQRKSKQFSGCPIGSLSVMLSGTSDKIRKRINFALNHMRHFYHQAFKDALENGNITSDQDANQLADLMLVIVQGVGIVGRSYNKKVNTQKLVYNIIQIFGHQI